MRDGEFRVQGTDARKRAVKDLKRCPLCGAINAHENAECFVCAWRGNFTTDPESVEQGLDELFDRCPELFDAMFEPSMPRVTLGTRIGAFLCRIKAWFKSYLAEPEADWP